MTEQTRKELEEKATESFENKPVGFVMKPELDIYVEGFIAGAEGYEKQKEINKELVDDIAELHKRIRELETQIKLGNEREAQDIRARFPC